MDKKQCNSCGETKCSCKNKEFTKAVVEIDNPEQTTLMRKVVIPASMGDDTAVPPVVGKYHNVLLYYEANHKSYLYSSDGIPTLLANGLTDYEEAVNLPQINGVTLIGNKTLSELGLNAFVFDTVADMSASTDLKNGDYAKTLGYYSLSDEGGAYYKISSTVPSSYYETLASGLYAELVIEDTMNVKQFGAKGDGVEDDTASFNTIIANCSNILIPDGVYLIDKFISDNNQHVTGIGNVTLKLKGSAAQAGIKSNTVISNIHFESTVESLPWNRVDIADRDNIIITGCSFKNFRDSAEAPNAWGITVRRSTNIKISNCYFEDNSQSDIAIVEGVTNAIIENCTGNALHINIEPNESTENKDITISNCDISILDMQENMYTAVANKNITVKDCTINQLRYDGATATILNCRVGTYLPLTSAGSSQNTKISYAGNLKIINSASFSKNLIEDPYIDNYKRNGADWYLGYSTFPYAEFMTNTNGIEGPVFTINPTKTSHTGTLRYKDIAVTAGSTYLIRTNTKDSTETTGTVNASLTLVAVFLNVSDETVETYNCSVNRHALGVTMPNIEENSVLVTVPEGATKVSIRLRNSSSNSNSTLTIRSIEMYKIDGNTYGSTNIPSLPVRNHREFYADAKPSGDTLTYQVGDKLYYNTPSTYIGAVCTTEGLPGTWSDYGALTS